LRFCQWLVLVISCRVFEQGLVEIVHGAFGVAEVVEGGGEEVFAELEFQGGAGGGDVGAGLGEIALGVHLAIAGVGEGGFQRGELGEQLGAELGLVFCGGGDEAFDQAGKLAEAGFVVFGETLWEKLGVRTAAFGERVFHSSFTLADGGAEKLQGLVFGDGAAGLGGLEGGAGGNHLVEGIERSLRGSQ